MTIVLYTLKSEKYLEGLIKILKKEAKNKNVIFVTTNKPYDHLINVLKERGMKSNKIFFIDCISKHVGIKKEPENCIFVESPQNLTAITIAITSSIKHLLGKKILLLDSLSALLIYNSAETIGEFSNFIINKLRSYGVDMVILALESDINKDIIKQIESFADEVKRW